MRHALKLSALLSAALLSLEDPQALLKNIVTQRLYNLIDDYWDTYPQKVAAVSAADVQRVAQKCVDLDHMQIVASAMRQRHALFSPSTERWKFMMRRGNQWHPAGTKRKLRSSG